MHTDHEATGFAGSSAATESERLLVNWSTPCISAPRRHVLVSAVTATGTAPVSDYYLSWHLLLRGVALEQIRGDRVLQEALVVRADPLHLAAMFHLSTATAIAYADIARALLERPIEASPLDQ
jgi:hypothetical protein